MAKVVAPYSGFKLKKYENVYDKLTLKTIELFQEYVMNTFHLHELATIAQLTQSREEKPFKMESWSYKIIKLNKAISFIEKQKHSGPDMSKGFRPIASTLLS